MKKQILLTTLVALSLFELGCAKKFSSVQPSEVAAVTTSVAPDPSRSADPGLAYTTGASAAFVPDSIAVLTQYAATHPLNAPSNFKMNVNVSDIGSGRYGGVVQISYYDNGNYYNGYFATGTGTVQTSYKNIDTGKPTAEFNQWFASGGKQVFHGFFQDQYGAVVLVVDDSLTSGDGGLPSEVNGSIWFKNFTPTYASQSPEKCWFIQIGPYDCRTFVGSNGGVDTTSALYPSSANGYVRLGTFTGLNVKSAFNK